MIYTDNHIQTVYSLYSIYTHTGVLALPAKLCRGLGYCEEEQCIVSFLFCCFSLFISTLFWMPATPCVGEWPWYMYVCIYGI